MDLAAMAASLPGPVDCAAHPVPALLRTCLDQGVRLVINPAGPAGLILDRDLLEKLLAEASSGPAFPEPASSIEWVDTLRRDAVALAARAASARREGAPERALPLLAQTIELLGQLGDLQHQVMTRNELAGVLIELGQTADARRELEWAFGAAVKVGSPRAVKLAPTGFGERLGLLLAGAAEELAGTRPSAARLCLERALGHMRSVGDELLTVDVLDRLASLDLREARYESARTRLDEALDLSRRLERHDLCATLLGDLAWVELHLDRLEACAIHLDECREMSGGLGDEALARWAVHLGWLGARLGDFPGAHERARQALVLGRDPAIRRLAAGLLWTLAKLERESGQPEAAARSAEEAAAVLESLGADST